MQEREILLETDCGTLRGVENARCIRFMGVPFARAERFAYAKTVDKRDGVPDATKPGPACPQNRGGILGYLCHA